jgi:hypothetical protein
MVLGLSRLGCQRKDEMKKYQGKLVGFGISLLFGLALNEFDTVAQKLGESISVRQAIDRGNAPGIKSYKKANKAHR